jgi:hypothetical protein
MQPWQPLETRVGENLKNWGSRGCAMPSGRGFVGKTKHFKVWQADHAIVSKRFKIDHFRTNTVYNNIGIRGARRVINKFNISNSSSSVPKPPGNATSARARFAR